MDSELVETFLRTVAHGVRSTLDVPRQSLAGHARRWENLQREKWAADTDVEYARIDAARRRDGHYIFLSDELPGSAWEYQNGVEKQAPVYLPTLAADVCTRLEKPEFAQPVIWLADKMSRARRGWAPSDVWNLDTWICASLADALEAHSAQMDFFENLDDTVALDNVAAHLRVWPGPGGELVGDGPGDLSEVTYTGFDWLVQNFDRYADGGVFLRTWAGQASTALAELARTAHGYPAHYDTGVGDEGASRWIWELTETSEALWCYTVCGETVYAVSALTWLREHLPNLWD